MEQLFSYRLKTLRIQAGLSQKEMAATIHVTASTMSNYENGIYLPPLRTAYEIALSLQCSLDYLIGLSEEKNIRDTFVTMVAEEEYQIR